MFPSIIQWLGVARKRPGKSCLWITCLLYLLTYSNVSQAGFEVISGSTRISSESIQHQAELDLTFGDDVITAINKSIEIRLLIKIKLYRVRPIIWDSLDSQWSSSFRIKYHGLSGRYVLHNDSNGRLETFDSIRETLDELAEFKTSVPLSDKDKKLHRYGYRTAFKILLDIDLLPSPLKLVAKISPQWNLASAWTSWPATD
ncbi:MAG: hypothetical protein ACI8P9_002314 [Parasphingorhabdus sp.]